LSDLQHALAAAILRRGVDTTRAREVSDWMAVPARIDPGSRLAVYTEGYPARLLEALRETFPAVAHLIGASTFAALVARFIRAVEIHSSNLNRCGESLPHFIREDAISESLPFLADLATLECAVQRAFHAYEQPALLAHQFEVATLAEWEATVLQFQPSVAVVHSPWPTLDLWRARDTPRDEIDIDLNDRAQSVVVERRGLDVHCTAIDHVEANLLAKLLAGAPLGEAIHGIATENGADIPVGDWFSAWMRSQWIVGYAVSPLPGT